MDLSVVVVEISALNDAAINILMDPINAAFLVTSEEPEVVSTERAGTPLINSQLVSAVLRTDIHPYDPRRGWVFGREDDTTDVILGTQKMGISNPHFSIDHNWTTLTPILKNLSGNGTKIYDPGSGRLERMMSSRAILPNAQYRISVGVLDLMLQVPLRNEAQQAEFDANIQRVRLEVEQAAPSLVGMRLQQRSTETPSVVGLKRKFVLGKVLGRGAMAVVYKATDHETGDHFAAKEYNLAQLNDLALSAFLRETKMLQTLKHKHIIEYVDMVKDPTPVLVMELAKLSLDDYQIVNDVDVLTVMEHVLEGLNYLHKQKITHSDIKPANILLTNDKPPVWKISDFGLSKMADIRMTYCGTLPYLAPEIGQHEYSGYTQAVDLWALGVVGVECSVGLPEGEFDLETKAQRGVWNAALLRQMERSRFQSCIRKMLVEAPHQRCTAEQALESLADYRLQQIRHPLATATEGGSLQRSGRPRARSVTRKS